MDDDGDDPRAPVHWPIGSDGNRAPALLPASKDLLEAGSPKTREETMQMNSPTRESAMQ